MKYMSDKLVCVAGLLGLGWVLICGGNTMITMHLLRQEKAHANSLQQRNSLLLREEHLKELKFQETKQQLSSTKSDLQEMRCQLESETSLRRKYFQVSDPKLLVLKPEILAQQALCWAIQHNDVPTVNALLKAGINPDCSEYGQTALVIAVETGYCEGPDFVGESPRNVLALVRALLAHGADVNRKCADGVTSPWTVAHRHSSEALVELLAKAGAREE